MTADTALRLSQWLGTSAEFWMNQKLYELRLAEQQAGDEIKRTIPHRLAQRELRHASPH